MVMSAQPVGSVAGRQWAELLHAIGLRQTTPRLMVLDALSALGHGRVEDIHQAVVERAPAVSLSTVYRQLETLTEHGVVSHTHLLAGTKTYQLVSHADHAHLVCRDCGAVVELEGSIAARFTAEVSGTHGFTVDFGHLSVFGRCAGCAPERAQEAG